MYNPPHVISNRLLRKIKNEILEAFHFFKSLHKFFSNLSKSFFSYLNFQDKELRHNSVVPNIGFAPFIKRNFLL